MNAPTTSAAGVIARTSGLADVEFDLYRDVHKGIRAELLGLVLAAGSLDPMADAQVEAFSARLVSFVELLDDHARHEEEHLDRIVAAHLPGLDQPSRSSTSRCTRSRSSSTSCVATSCAPVVRTGGWHCTGCISRSAPSPVPTWPTRRPRSSRSCPDSLV